MAEQTDEYEKSLNIIDKQLATALANATITYYEPCENCTSGSQINWTKFNTVKRANKALEAL